MKGTRDADRIHDAEIMPPAGCPKGLTDCEALSRVSSADFESFMCCGETAPDGRTVLTDIFRFCIKSTHDTGVDFMVNLDERDATDSAFVLLGALSSEANLKAMTDG